MKQSPSPNNITRAIVDATVSRGLKEIAEDPKRSIRKLADMGKQFSKGRFLQEIYSIIQDLLRNDDSPYYTAIEHLLRNTDLNAIRHFGINIGYNSLTYGAKIIRDLEKTKPYFIPWGMVLRMNATNPDCINGTDVDTLIRQGCPLGIYTYFIRCSHPLSSITDMFQVFQSHPDCAFCCMLPEGHLTANQLEDIKKCTNTMFLFQANAVSSMTNVENMKRQKSLYGMYDYYNGNNAEKWICEDRLKEFIPYDSSFLILIPEDNTPIALRKKVASYVKEHRLQPRYPFIAFEMRYDFLEIDKIISENAHYFEMLENGDILIQNDEIFEYHHAISLERILMASLPNFE